MNQQQLLDLVDAWIRYHRAFEEARGASSFEHPDAWADDKVRFMMLDPDRGFGADRLISEYEELSWQVLNTLVERAPDEMLSSIGVGPFENWITDARAGRYERKLRDRMEQDDRFKQMISAAQNVPALVHDMLRSSGLKHE